jgi:hypothetical protein
MLNRRGSAENPLAPQEVEEKFRAVARSCLAPAQIGKVVELVRSMEKQESLSELVGIVSAPALRA